MAATSKKERRLSLLAKWLEKEHRLAQILPHWETPKVELTSWVFLRALGLIYLMAFLSLGPQIVGLVGADGILPAVNYLGVLVRYVGAGRFWMAPSLFWLFPKDGGLLFLCYGGAALSVLVILDVAPAATLALCWLFYLSISAVARDFMMFQWDVLLLETGFLAIFLAPLRLKPMGPVGPGPEPTVVWLFRWLLFRVMFSSGVVKLASHDPTWRNLTALTYHYQTQPLPTRLAWYANLFPLGFQKFSCLAVFFLELAVPFLFLFPRRFRQMGAALTAGFQLLIMITGNYGFFNLLTLALCLMLLDDVSWPERLKKWRDAPPPAHHDPSRGLRWPQAAVAPFAGLILILSCVELGGTLRILRPWMAPAVGLAQIFSPLRLANGYGLFAVMTTDRPEIVVEGSNDGQTWQEYEFKYKPGDLSRAPGFVEPHMPRLDWQMWFAALGSYRENLWFLSFCSHLLRGTPSVLRLLAKNPFPDAPPHYLRAEVYVYCFNTFETRRATGCWWSRQPKGLYCPMFSLRPAGSPPPDAAGPSPDGGS